MKLAQTNNEFIDISQHMLDEIERTKLYLENIKDD
jgi:hypothetical protein